MSSSFFYYSVVAGYSRAFAFFSPRLLSNPFKAHEPGMLLVLYYFQINEALNTVLVDLVIVCFTSGALSRYSGPI